MEKDGGSRGKKRHEKPWSFSTSALSWGQPIQSGGDNEWDGINRQGEGEGFQGKA